jgi:1-acyl-sn-glycerol-3-phosphate acyltransferase
VGIAWWIVLGLLYIPFSLLVKQKYRNLTKIPPTGGAILVLNHVAHLDPLCISKMVFDAGRRPRFMAKESIFDVPVAGLFMKWMGHVPVKRGTVEANAALQAGVEALRNGGVIIVHPEGTVTRDPDGWPMQAKTGAARLAALVPEVPVIPISQWGVQEQVDFYAKRFKFLPRPRHVASVGDPIDLADFRGKDITPTLLKEMTDVIMKRLRSDVAELRGIPAPDGPLYHWVRPVEGKKSA